MKSLKRGTAAAISAILMSGLAHSTPPDQDYDGTPDAIDVGWTGGEGVDGDGIDDIADADFVLKDAATKLRSSECFAIAYRAYWPANSKSYCSISKL